MDQILEKLNVIIKQTESNDVLLAAFIGAIAAIIPQLLNWYFTTRKEKKEKILEIKSELHRLEFLIKEHYRELAMHKAHKFYWWAKFEKSEKENNSEDMSKFYNSHMASSARVRETEVKISESFSEFYKLAIKFQHITKFHKGISNLFEEYHNYNPKKPNKIDPSKVNLSKEEAKEEKRLQKEYLKYGRIIDRIVQLINKE